MQVDEENASDASEKSKTGQVTPEKKPAIDHKKDGESISTTSGPSNSKTDGKAEIKEEEDQESDHEDPHSEYFFFFFKDLCVSI